MGRIASMLLCAASAIWLGQAAPPPVPKAAPDAQRQLIQAAQALAGEAQTIAQEGAIVQQFEQQWGPQFRQLYRTELHFMRLVCQPTKQQYAKIAADAEPALKATMRKFAVNMRTGGEAPDPRTPIADALANSVRATLSPDQTARYRDELDQRSAARKRMVVLNLVAKVDKVLVLTREQRVTLSEILADNWSDSWNQTQMLGSQYFPQMPDDKMTPVLTETQKTVWRGLPYRNIRWGFNLGMMQAIELEEEVWDEDGPKK
jgi:hypothetical protein